MLRTRILLVVISALVIWLIFLLPRVVVEDDNQLKADPANPASSSAASSADRSHTTAPAELLTSIRQLRGVYSQASSNQKSAIFADSLADLYHQASQFDSSAWFAEQAATFFNTPESFLKAGNSYYEAYTFALEKDKQTLLAEKARLFLGKVLDSHPKDFESKSKIAMTYLSSASPMQGIMMLREILAEDPKNETALFNMGMLSVQSGQYDKAIERLQELVSVNANHIQGQLLLGIAYLNKGDKQKAREQFEKVKQLDKDPSVQATVDSYLNDLK